MRDSGTAQTITIALWREMLNRERGGVARTEKAMGVNPDTLRAARRNGGLRLRHVTDAIEAMGIPPSVFFNDAIGGVSTTAAERFMARGAEFALRKLVELPTLADDIKPDRLTEDDLARLNAARFEDPRAAAEQAAGIARLAARDGRRGDAAAAVARKGSALRVAEMWEPAWVCVWWALRHAAEGSIKGDALRRSASVVSDFGQFHDAAELAGASGVEYMESGNVAGVGRALLGQGIFLMRAGDLKKAILRLQAAAVFLPADDNLRHLTLHKTLGNVLVRLGDYKTAEQHAEKAETIDGVHGRFAIHVQWLRARIAAGCRNDLHALACYQEVVQKLEDSPGNAALAAAEMCRVYARGGHAAQAIATASTMARFAMPKGQNSIVAAALLDLYRSANEGILTLKLINETIGRIRTGLEQRAVL